MSRPVSLLVWRDARTDPPTGQTRGVFVEFENGKVWTAYANTLPCCEGSTWDGYDDVRRWAEIPVVSDLTDEDMDYTIVNVEQVAQFIEEQGPDFGGAPADEVVADIRARRDRLRAALGGEKEEA